MALTGSERSQVAQGWAEVAAVVAIGGAIIIFALGVIAHVILRPAAPASALAAPVAFQIEDGLTGTGPGGRPPGDAPIASRAFAPAMTFQLRDMAGGDRPEFCAWRTSPRVIELGHAMGCVDEVWITRPYAVDCGVVDDTPDAATLTRAVLSRSSLHAQDLGPIVAGRTVPAALFSDAPSGRVVQVVGRGPFAGRIADPDACRLLPDPASDDDVVEIRRDLTARFILFDVDDELVVIRAAFGGHDRASGQAGFARGYGRFDTDTLDHLLASIYAIRFD